ncbi:unnamed protein product [Tuber aestivum]|uniref:Thioredoxin domain-containing protein n=1 Tax=Tuber aestivum TaxID=59557 RepID=A0A292Q272_9PEZI|nr:unnamed protein product [Tuber aestivum]
MISVGSSIPPAPESLWVERDNNTVSLPSSGKYIIVGVPGAFTPPCSSQVPGYIENYDKLKEKGISAAYVVAVNDIFVVNAWKEKLANDSGVQFLSDSRGMIITQISSNNRYSILIPHIRGAGEFTNSVGLGFDASGLLGNTRSKRYVAIVEDGKVVNLQVEDEAPNITVTHVDKVLGSL